MLKQNCKNSPVNNAIKNNIVSKATFLSALLEKMVILIIVIIISIR